MQVNCFPFSANPLEHKCHAASRAIGRAFVSLRLGPKTGHDGAVSPEHQGQGIGRLLVREAITTAKRLGYAKMVLWTQPAMLAAQHLYGTSGFVRAPERDFQRGDGRSFLVFTCEL